MPILRHLASIPRTTLKTSTLRRTMSTAPGMFNWIVIVPDKAGMLEKRLEVRGQHFEGMKQHEASGLIKMGGESLAHTAAVY